MDKTTGGHAAWEAAIQVLWLDEELLAVNKPAGLLTLPDGYDPTKPYLVGLLEERFGRLWVVHRLDRHTSGVLVLARTAEAHRCLNIQFERRLIEKVYHALVHGSPTWDRRVVDQPLRANVGRRHRTIVDPERGKPARTDFRVLERFGRYAFLEARPHTGRPHQIRAHLTWLGHPLISDPLYTYLLEPSERHTESIIARPALHALSLTFQHPGSGESMTIEAPYPEDFRNALRILRGRHGDHFTLTR